MDLEDTGEHVHTLTAQLGAYSYRVIAPRRLTYEELTAAVRRGLKTGAIREPEPGETATLYLAPRRPRDDGAELRALERWRADQKRRTNRKRRASVARWGGALALLALLAAGYVAWPTLAAYQLLEAARATDVEALRERVDFPALRESLRGQMVVHASREMERQAEEGLPGAAPGAALGVADGTMMIDSIATPEAIAGFVRLAENNDPTKLDDGFESMAAAFHAGSFDGLTRYVIHHDDTTVRFRLDGLTWRLYALETEPGTLERLAKERTGQ